MADNTITANMGLIVPTVGLELSPTWAQDLNASLTILDQHNHTAGSGVLIPADALDINTDLSFQGHNAVLLRSTRYSPQVSVIGDPTDLNCLSVAGVDLYYNDGNGNQIRITQSGAIAGTPGSITNLVSPASVTYVPATPAFVFQSDALTAANLDGGSVTLRNITASSFGVTLNPPVSLAADYDITFPSSLPGAQSFVTLDSSGNIGAPIPFSQGITAANIANATITGTQIVTNVTLNGSITATGNVTAQADVFSNSSFTMSGLQVALDAGGANFVQVRDIASASSFPIVVSAQPTTSGLFIVRGTINASGTKVAGEGFTSTRLSTGRYAVTFTTNFLDLPTVTGTVQVNPGNQGVFSVSGVSTSGFTTELFLNNGIIDSLMSFIAIGQRLN